MRLTLDWDSDADRGEHFRDVRDRNDSEQATLDGSSGPNPWQLRRSSSGNGYHYVEWSTSAGWRDVLDLRERHGDDPNRVRLDRLRHNHGSPFLQVLYRTKYMSRWGWQPESGNDAEVVDGDLYLSEADRIKRPDGTLDYLKIARMLSESVYGSQSALAESMSVHRSTVGGWLRDEARPSESNRKKLRRRARSNGLGHYLSTESGGKSAEKAGYDVRYFDPDEPGEKELRRTVVEYADAPWDWDIGGDDREYALLNVHTGTYNPEHSEEQLKHVHDDIMDHVLDCLSPSNPETGQRLDLDRETRHPISREQDSVNYEAELLDVDEARYYRGNFVSSTGAASQGVTTATAADNILFEVLLWDGNMTGVEWRVLGVWDGSTVSDATVVDDSAGWW